MVYRQEGIEKNVKVAVVVYKLCIAYQYYASPGRSAGVRVEFLLKAESGFLRDAKVT